MLGNKRIDDKDEKIDDKPMKIDDKMSRFETILNNFDKTVKWGLRKSLGAGIFCFLL
ncbi:hypothetical protein [Planomicrobium okeanokoites]|uniref:Uncharacterized protein n=1 Tax=Planomicrobium okeanokoites TaxID=244 RepID=A0ABV7KL32_PLAOK|nr:hypothetical protein [Planomicrobium okeanokoites]